MIKVNELKGKMVAKGYTQADVAKILGITPDTMSRKLRKGVFRTNEAEKMIEILDIQNPMEIFFAKE